MQTSNLVSGKHASPSCVPLDMGMYIYRNLAGNSLSRTSSHQEETYSRSSICLRQISITQSLGQEERVSALRLIWMVTWTIVVYTRVSISLLMKNMCALFWNKSWEKVNINYTKSGAGRAIVSDLRLICVVTWTIIVYMCVTISLLMKNMCALLRVKA